MTSLCVIEVEIEYATQQSLKTAAQEKLRREQQAARIARADQQVLNYGIYLSEIEYATQQSLKEEKVRQLQPTLNSFNQATDDLLMQIAIQNSLQTKEDEDLKAAIEASKQTFKQETLKRMQERSKPALRQTEVYEQNSSLLSSSTPEYPRLDMFTEGTLDIQNSLGQVKQSKVLPIRSPKFREEIKNDKVDLLKNSLIENRQIMITDILEPLGSNVLPVKHVNVRKKSQDSKVDLLKKSVLEDRQPLVMDMLEELPNFDLPVVPGASQYGVIPPAPPAPAILPVLEIKKNKQAVTSLPLKGADNRGSLLEQIREGIALKKVDSSQQNMYVKEAGQRAVENLFGKDAQEKLKELLNIQEEDNDNWE